MKLLKKLCALVTVIALISSFGTVVAAAASTATVDISSVSGKETVSGSGVYDITVNYTISDSKLGLTMLTYTNGTTNDELSDGWNSVGSKPVTPHIDGYSIVGINQYTAEELAASPGKIEFRVGMKTGEECLIMIGGDKLSSPAIALFTAPAETDTYTPSVDFYPSGVGAAVGGSTVKPTEPTEPTEPLADAPFDDITWEHEWALSSIVKLKELGVINGKDGNNFEPDADVTRAEYTKMIVSLLGIEVNSNEVPFTDCPADEWYTPYIKAGFDAGIINGISETEFAPNDTITREQACAILGRAYGFYNEEATLKFTDTYKISEYAVPYIAALDKLGIVKGYEGGVFAPYKNITRAESAKILAGALDVINK